MSQGQARRKKAPEAVSLSHKNSSTVSKQPKVVRPDIENIYPFTIPNEADVPVEIHQHIINLEREYLQLHTTLTNNREKSEQLFANLASLMDERGISAQEIASLLMKIKYSQPKN